MKYMILIYSDPTTFDSATGDALHEAFCGCSKENVVPLGPCLLTSMPDGSARAQGAAKPAAEAAPQAVPGEFDGILFTVSARCRRPRTQGSP